MVTNQPTTEKVLASTCEREDEVKALVERLGYGLLRAMKRIWDHDCNPVLVSSLISRSKTTDPKLYGHLVFHSQCDQLLLILLKRRLSQVRCPSSAQIMIYALQPWSPDKQTVDHIQGIGEDPCFYCNSEVFALLDTRRSPFQPARHGKYFLKGSTDDR